MNTFAPSDSITAAKAANASERAAVTKATGIRFVGDRIVLPQPRLIPMPCLKSGCCFVAVRGTVLEAQRAMLTHYSVRHGLTS